MIIFKAKDVQHVLIIKEQSECIYMTQGRIIDERSTTEQFIQKARVEHGDKYGYDNVNYVNSKTKVNIFVLIKNGYGILIKKGTTVGSNV